MQAHNSENTTSLSRKQTVAVALKTISIGIKKLDSYEQIQMLTYFGSLILCKQRFILTVPNLLLFTACILIMQKLLNAVVMGW